MKATRLALVVIGATCSLRVAADDPAGTPEDWPPAIPRSYYGLLLGDRLETRLADDVDAYVWDVQGWYGSGRNRAWVKTEGEGEFGRSPESAELQVLYSHLFAPFWDWQVGIRHDFSPNPERTHAVIGIQGVAPYEFELDSALFVDEEGEVTARLEAEYNLNITQRLVLQPRLEVNAAFSGIPEVSRGSGINATELGLRLRYQIRREFAPYVSVSWERLYGDTRDMARRAGEPVSVTAFVAGVRFWF
ncbi:MAG: copper resistance protein B [Gammaproteobacteria bacterium]